MYWKSDIGSDESFLSQEGKLILLKELTSLCVYFYLTQILLKYTTQLNVKASWRETHYRWELLSFMKFLIYWRKSWTFSYDPYAVEENFSTYNWAYNMRRNNKEPEGGTLDIVKVPLI